MTTYKSGDVLYAPLDYVGSTGRKPRPLVVLLDTGDQDVVVARVTGHLPRDGLPRASTLRLSKVATIPCAQVIKQLGTLSAADRAAVQATLQKIIDDWQ
jgi:mRNA interferase MazF